MKSELRILIIGGYGTFGGRLVELLESEPRLALLVAGRSLEKARTFCQSRLQAHADLIPTVFDRSKNVVQQLSGLSADLVVDASGPFQAYGDGPYEVIEACLAHRLSYLDLADGSDFVAGVSAFDAQAHTANLFILSGVSSFPVLTAAVVRHLAKPMTRVTSIRGGIAPSPYAGVGANVIRAIAGYAGQRITLKRDGRTCTGHPLTESMRFTIAPPGHVPLRNTLFSLVDVPDLRALSTLWPEARTIWMGAGPVPEILHRALIACAWLVRLNIVRSLSPLVPLMLFATNHLRWGDHRGGMFVQVEGENNLGNPVCRSWHLLAEGDDGPLIPSMVVQRIVQNMLEGRFPPPGARAGVCDLELADYEKLFASRTIYTGTREEHRPIAQPLYVCILGSACITHLVRTVFRANNLQAMAGRRACYAKGSGH